MANFHFSWYCDPTTYQHGNVKEFWTDEDSILKQLEQLKKWQNEEAKKIPDLIVSSKFTHLNEPVICGTQYGGAIPVMESCLLLQLVRSQKEMKEYDKEIEDIMNLQKSMYDMFFNGSGCFVMKNLYDPSLMEEFNAWCNEMISGSLENTDKTKDENSTSNPKQNVSDDLNFVHPTQKGKYLINDVLSRLASTNNIMLLCNLLYDSDGAFLLNWLIYVMLGFGKIGAAAAHWITPNSNSKQYSHVDFPININSSPFWGMSPDKVRKLTTRTQLNTILPHHSCQVLIACDAMDEKNGSTEVIPCSQKISNLDLAITKESSFYNMLEGMSLFRNVQLDQGDVLIFNRRLIHRGGANKSDTRRNALILQYVSLWGVGQEILNVNSILSSLNEYHHHMVSKNEYSEARSDREQFNDFLVRINPPYPKDTRTGT